jgi:hypothetical protein
MILIHTIRRIKIQISCLHGMNNGKFTHVIRIEITIKLTKTTTVYIIIIKVNNKILKVNINMKLMLLITYFCN